MLAVVALHNTFLHFDQFGLTFIVNSKLSFDLILQILTYFLILLYQLLNLMRIFLLSLSNYLHLPSPIHTVDRSETRK